LIKSYIPILFLCLCSFFCDNKKEIPVYVARVDDKYLSFEEIKQTFDTNLIRSKTKLQEYINQWVNTNLLYKEAQNRDITASDEYKSLVEKAKMEIAANLLLENEVYNAKIDISEDEILEYYKYHKDEFLLGRDIVNISYIIFSELNIGEDFKKNVNSNNWKIMVERYKFNLYAKYYIADEDSAIFKQNELSPVDIWRMADQMQPNQISGPIKVIDGYIILKLNDSQKAGEIGNLNYASSEIVERLTIDKKRKRYLDFLHDLQRKYHPEVTNDIIFK
jgi:hypothetical protein